jgi:hypothetical protein
MRRWLTDLLNALFKAKPRPKSSGATKRPSPSSSRPTAHDIGTDGVRIEYSPDLDGNADPGEVVWTWVPFEDDPSQGKDRPVVIVGRRGQHLVGVQLTSKQHDNEPQFEVGTGQWDREGRTSYAKLERLLEIDPAQVRREGAVLPKPTFDGVVKGLERVHGPLA